MTTGVLEEVRGRNVGRKVPAKIIASYSSGIVGWSILVNIISVILVFLYAPTEKSGLPVLIYQGAIFGAVNVLTIITTSGRLLDALFDPIIAQKSDMSTNKSGRRIPFMKWAIIPACLFCWLVFIPLTHEQSGWNALWLGITLIVFFVSATTYGIPYYAMLPELASDLSEKVKLTTWQSVGYVVGIGLASNAFNLCAFFQEWLHWDKLACLQLTIGLYCVLAGIFMVIPVLFIKERDWCHGEASSVKLMPALRQSLTNKNFRLYLLADFAFNTSITIIQTGLIFFVTILVKLPESIGNKLMITLVLSSFLFYPVIGPASRKFGIKPIISFSLVMLGCVFIGIYFLGTFDVSPEMQIFAVVCIAALPMATMNILPLALLADIIEKDSIRTKVNKEALYFAVRYFFVKLAQTCGIAIFAMLLIYGKDINDDLGIRLSGIVGSVLCIAAGIYFLRYKENR